MLNVVSNYSTNLMFRDHLNLNNLTLKYPKYTFFEVSGYLTPNPLPIQNILFFADLHGLEQVKESVKMLQLCPCDSEKLLCNCSSHPKKPLQITSLPGLKIITELLF